MATSAFKSTTKRPSIGGKTDGVDSSLSNRTGNHRRSRSLSRFSRRVQPVDDYDETPVLPKRSFGNTVSGSDPLEISLDDLAIELFESGNRGRLSRRSSGVNTSEGSSGASLRRGRSVSRHGSRVGDLKGNSLGGARVVESVSRRRRSVSLARCPISDSESDRDHAKKFSSHADLKNLYKGNGLKPSLQKPTASNHRSALARSMSQNDFSKLHDGYSSQSSALTDDEVKDAHSCTNGIERTIRTVYTQTKEDNPIADDDNGGLYQVMRKELRHAVQEIKMDLEQAMSKPKNSTLANGGDRLQSNNSDTCKAVSTIRRNYASKLEQSERRKQDLLNNAKNITTMENPSFKGKRSNSRSKMSKQLIDEAEQIFDDFLSNVEDTDISSLDGEMSDYSLGGITKPKSDSLMCYRETKKFQTPLELDGVVLPWLQWETTSNDVPSMSCKKKIESPATLQTILWNAPQNVSHSLITAPEQSNYTTSSSHGSSSPPGVVDGPPMSIEGNLSYPYNICGIYKDQSLNIEPRKSWFDMDEYLKLKRDEDLLSERRAQRHRINSGGLLLCNNTLF